MVVEEPATPIKDKTADTDAPAKEPDNAAEATEEVAEPAAPSENAGLADLDKASQLKVTARSLPDLNDVIDDVDTAIEKGLDKDNLAFANQLLISSLLQRATILSQVVLDRPLADPRRDPRWMQIRQFAVNDLLRVIEIDNDIWEAHLLMGRLQALPLGDPKTAKRELTKVIDAADVTPTERAQAYTLRGALQTDDEKRAADFDAAVQIVPDKPDFYRIRAQYLYGKDDFKKALADIDKALELEPDHAGSQELRGLVLLGLKRFDEARDAFQKASELAPKAVLPYQHLGEAYRQQGDLQKAVEQLTKALELEPNDAATLLLRANLYIQLKDTDAALADVDAVIKSHPQLLVAHLLQAEILASADRVDEAIADLEKLLAVAPNETKLLEPLATMYLVGGEPQKSIDMFAKVLELKPDDYHALRYQGDAYLGIGKHAEAVADFDAALKLNDEDDGLLNNFAWVLATSPDDNVRDGKRAVELATKAAELTSYSLPHVLSTLAAAYAETGDFETAKKWSKKAVELGEDDEIREQLGNELASYEAGKPWRERQTTQEKPMSKKNGKKPNEKKPHKEKTQPPNEHTTAKPPTEPAAPDKPEH